MFPGLPTPSESRASIEESDLRGVQRCPGQRDHKRCGARCTEGAIAWTASPSGATRSACTLKVAMSQPAPPLPDHSATAEKKSAAALSVTAAACMAVLKLVVGLLSGSLGLLSDAAHSGIDLAGSTLTLFSVRVSDKPADEDHPYGHAKVENLSAFIE